MKLRTQQYDRIDAKILEEIKRRGGKCEVASCKENSLDELEFAHLVNNGLNAIHRERGKLKRRYDVIKHPDYYALFCTFHHRLFDEGRFLFKGRYSPTGPEERPPGIMDWGVKN